MALLLVFVVATLAGQAQTFQVLHNFTGSLDGANPWAGLTFDVAGNLYGVAQGGGNGPCTFYGTAGCGTAFKLTRKNGAWTFAPLYSFKGGKDGEFPVAGLTIASTGVLYGTSLGGGAGACTFYNSSGCGTIFSVKPTPTRPPTPLSPWVENVLYSFTGGADGANPAIGGVIFDQAGNLYGTTAFGGTYGLGVVFELSPSGNSWTQTVLYSFTGGNDGISPYGGLVFDKAGNLYGTTAYGGGAGCGGTGCGTIYKLTHSGGGWSEQVIYSFQGGNDGAQPEAGLIVDPSGNLYGGTYYGGALGGGTVYELAPSGGSWTFNVLHNFYGTQWGLASRLTMDPAGNLYGTTQFGGANGDGNVFELTPSAGSWTYTDLHDFTYGSDGGTPVGPVIVDASGNLYGTAFGGGANTCGGYGCGVVFEITPSGVPNFTISVSPPTLTVVQGNQGTATVTTTIGGGFNSGITLSASGVPLGTTVSFNPNPIPAPGAGSSMMTVIVGGGTPSGVYPITITGKGSGIQQSTTLTLTVISASAWAIGFDFRSSSDFVSDPPGDTYVLSSTSYPTTFNGVSFGWANTNLVQARDRNNQLDPRLAGINFALNGSPATFYVDLPASGIYSLSLAMGDAGYSTCEFNCELQFLDGNKVLATLIKGPENLGYFYDAQGNIWSADDWPAQNVSLQLAIAGKQLTMVLGTNQNSGDDTPIAFLGVTQVTSTPNFLISASPSSFSVPQGQQGSSTITTTISGGFNNSITLSASGAPPGTTVSFNPNPIPAPGAGSSTMTVSVGANTPAGLYPITVTGTGGGIQQTTTVNLTVTRSNFILTASPPMVTVAQGAKGSTTVMTTILGAFNSAITLSAAKMPPGSTVSFNPNPIPAPGGGTSTMTMTVGASTPPGTYPITVTGNGGGLQQNFTVMLTVVTSVWQQGFDFRGTANYVNDPPDATSVLATTIFPTEGGLTTYGWAYTTPVITANRNNSVDPRLAGINYVNNGTPSQFYVNLSAPGTYNLSLAMGDAGYPGCLVRCQIQFLDGNAVLATLTRGPANVGYFYDAAGNIWSTAQWPTKNVSRQVTLAGTQLTVRLGSSSPTGDTTPIAYLGVSQVSAGPTFALRGPSSLSVGQGQYSTAGVFTILIGGFNGAINLSATGGPAGTIVSFNPSTIPPPGAGTSIMTVNVPSNAPLGNYPLTVTAKSGGIAQNLSVVLTVTVADPPSFTLTAPGAISTAPGGKVTGTVSTTVANGFNSAVNLSATGGPGGTTVSFNPSTIPAPGSGSSVMTVNVPAGAAFGSYPITVTASSGQGNQTGTATLTVSASGAVNLPSGTGWASLGGGLSFCDVSPGYTYYNPEVGAVDAFDFLTNCIRATLVAWSGGAADTANERYYLWTSGHNNYQGNEMYVLNLQGPSPSVARVTDPGWSVVNSDVPPDCACKGTYNCGQGMWHDGAGNPVKSPYSESGSSGPLFESIPAPDGSAGQPSCGYGSRFTPNGREIYAGMVYHPSTNKLFTWGGAPAADPSGFMFSNWVLDLNQNPAAWTRLKDSSYAWITAAAYDYTSGHSTSGSDLVFDENQALYAYNPSTDTYKVLGNNIAYIGYNTNLDLDPVHHYLVMENGDDNDGYHLRLLNIDSCDGTNCTETNLDDTPSCAGALGYWAGVTWDSKRNVMAIFPSSTNCNGVGCTEPFNTVYLLNPDPNNPVTITYQGQPQTIPPQQCFAASYGPTPPTSFGPGVYSRFRYYPNEDVYLYIPDPSDLWILRLEP